MNQFNEKIIDQKNNFNKNGDEIDQEEWFDLNNEGEYDDEDDNDIILEK